MLGRLRKDCRVARETRETREKAALRQSKAEIGVLGALLRVAVGELLRNVYAANQFGIFARPVFRVFRGPICPSAIRGVGLIGGPRRRYGGC